MDDEELKDRIRRLESQVNDLQTTLHQILSVLAISDNLGLDTNRIERIREEMDW